MFFKITQRYTVVLSANYKLKILKLSSILKWRRKIRKTRYVAFKKRLVIYKTEYSSDINFIKPFFYKNLFLDNTKNYLKFIITNNILFKKIQFNLKLNKILFFISSYIRNNTVDLNSIIGFNDLTLISNWLSNIIHLENSINLFNNNSNEGVYYNLKKIQYIYKFLSIINILLI